MALDSGALLGHYEIIDLVGRGGMGEVYKARDLRLGRSVAIKVIGSALADRTDVQRRFEEECRVAATLDHPRICAVHDVGREGGVLYLVMEFLEGEPLSQKTARGPLPKPQVLGYAIEIAAAVHYAHRHGIIHRDLKPGNVFITPSGVKVLDFGLAKLRQGDAPPTREVADERTAPPRTVEGSVFGTAHYLPPERLEGKPADHRSDVFGFGTIVYEMAAGRRAFDAATPAALIAAILTTDPPPLPSAFADVDWVIRRCLARNPDERWQSLGDVEAALKWMARTSSSKAETSGRRLGGGRTRLGLIASVVILALGALGAAAFLALRSRDRPGLAGPVAFTIQPPAGGAFTGTQSSVDAPQLAISPDGRELAFVASGRDGVSKIWLRALEEVAATPLAGTEGAAGPFWSPDGRALAFFVGDELKVIDRRGGPARPVAQAPSGRGGTWNTEGVILFAPDTGGPLRRVAASGGSPAADIPLRLEPGDIDHRWPQFLPDGRHFVWFVRSADPAKQGIYLGTLDSADRTMLVRARSSAHYAPPGRLLYVVEGTLLSAKLDIGGRRLLGQATPVALNVGASSNFSAAITVSANGVIAYGERAASDALVWIDREGKRLGTAATRARYVDFRISPDGGRVALSIVDPQTDKPDVSVLDLARPTLTRLTTSPATDASPVWAPDGSRLVFRSNRQGAQDLYISSSSATGADVLFLSSAVPKYPTDWSRSGFIVYQAYNKGTGWDLAGAPSSHPKQSESLVNTTFNEAQGRLSPDERWLAYTSDISGMPEVYVESRQTRQKVPVSTHDAAEADWHGAGDPRWRANGRELFYVTADGTLTAVPITVRGGVLTPGRAHRLFDIGSAPIAPPYISEYDPAPPDGSKFLVLVRPRTLALTVLMNRPLD